MVTLEQGEQKDTHIELLMAPINEGDPSSKVGKSEWNSGKSASELNRSPKESELAPQE